MKKIFNKSAIVALAFVSVLALVSCQSTGNTVQPSVDSYDSDGSATDSNGAESGKKTSVSNSDEKNKFNFMDAFFGKKYMELDEFSLSTTTATFGIKQKTAAFVYGLKRKLFGFGAPYMAAYYYLTFDDVGRHVYINAVDSYLKDFEAKRLTRSSKKTEKVYGFTNTRLEWGPIKSSTPNSGEGSAYFGYAFKNKSPYFMITVYPVDNEKRIAGDDMADPQSMFLHFYFTKAQAKQLAAFLSDENIAGIFVDNVPESEEEEAEGVESVGDEY